MSASLLIKVTLVGLFVASALFVHFRGRARLLFLRQLVNHSAWFTPYNSLMYLFSSVPSKPYLDRSRFPELDELKSNWQTIHEETLNLFDEGHIRAVLSNNEAGFSSLFKKSWKRFYLTWYDGPLPSAQRLCPKIVELVSRIPNVKGAMLTLLPGGSHPNPHRDPFGGSLRYHLGLSTPDSDNYRIYVNGQPYAWRGGENVMFDETFVHWVKNETEQTRVIPFCDIERPLRSRLLTRLNRWISGILGRATVPQNVEGECVGSINQAYSVAIRGGNTIDAQVKRFKHAYPKAYRVLRPVLAVVLLVILYRWIFG